MPCLLSSWRLYRDSTPGPDSTPNDEEPLAYLTDTCGLPGATERFLREWQPDVVVLDTGHPSSVVEPTNHNSLPMALQIIERFDVSAAYLTDIGHDLDRELAESPVSLPANVRVPKDGEEVCVGPMTQPSMAC